MILMEGRIMKTIAKIETRVRCLELTVGGLTEKPIDGDILDLPIFQTVQLI